MPDEETIELWPCGYDAFCKLRNCRAKPTMVARSVDSGGRAVKQFELCQVHCEQASEHERAKGRQIVICGPGH